MGGNLDDSFEIWEFGKHLRMSSSVDEVKVVKEFECMEERDK